MSPELCLLMQPNRLFERGAAIVGLDFLAHPFWDKYIEYEERQESPDRVYAIHARIIRIPMHQYARYYERFRTLSHTRPLVEVAPTEVIARFQEEVAAEALAYGGMQRPELEVERDIRAKLDNMYYEVFTVTQNEVSKRWTYESENKRPYFHVTELEHSQLNNWRKYLDFEEAEGDFSRIVCLYERCLVTCALYDEFWFRYARWMSAQAGKEEEVRNIYIRASTMFVPVSRPGIRMQWAYFEESCGRVDVAIDIHESILLKLPDCIEVVVSWAQLQRRQHGIDAAIQVYKDHIDAPTVNLYTKAALVAEWANLLWKAKGSADEARAGFLKNVQWYADSRIFWEKWYEFELEQPAGPGKDTEQAERLRHVFEELRSRSRLSQAVKRELTQIYLNFLVQRGGKDAMKTFLEVDREMFGSVQFTSCGRFTTNSAYSPPSVAALSKSASGVKEENGAVPGELDDASKPKAEARYLNFYELYIEPNPDAQGPAVFN